MKQTAQQILRQDIEDVPEKQKRETKQTPQTITTQTPHDSAYVFSQLKTRHTKLVFPTLDTTEKSNKGTFVLVALVTLSVFGAWGMAYEVQYQLTPHVNGICAAPAVIQSGGCFNVQVSTGSNGQTITTLVPAGVLRP